MRPALDHIRKLPEKVSGHVVAVTFGSVSFTPRRRDKLSASKQLAHA
jgi:hypothetical protein